MKKFLALILVLASIFALAACGDTQKAEVVENVDPVDNSVVIETPPAIVSGPDTPADQYPSVSVLPTTAPTTAPTTETGTVPVPGTGDNTAAGTTGDSGTAGTLLPAPGTGDTATANTNVTYADDSGEDYTATVSQEERNNSWIGYISGDWVNFRVGPGTKYKIYESLPRATAVRVLGFTDTGWAKIQYDDLIGFVARNYISTTEPREAVIIVTETPAPTPTPGPTVVPIG